MGRASSPTCATSGSATRASMGAAAASTLARSVTIPPSAKSASRPKQVGRACGGPSPLRWGRVACILILQ
eukprot:3095630-Prymnesium_polylepis.1